MLGGGWWYHDSVHDDGYENDKRDDWETVDLVGEEPRCVCLVPKSTDADGTEPADKDSFWPGEDWFHKVSGGEDGG